MENSPLSQWLGGQYVITLKEPAGERVQGVLRDLVPEHHLTLENAVHVSTDRFLGHYQIPAAHVSDIVRLQVPEPGLIPPIPSAPDPMPAHSQPTAPQAPFQDPAILTMGRRPGAQAHADAPHRPHPNIGEKRIPPAFTNLADQTTSVLFDHTDAASAVAPITPTAHVVLSPTGIARQDTTEEETPVMTPAASTARSSNTPRERNRGKRGGKKANNEANPEGDSSHSTGARPPNHGKGWRQTPILQSNRSFQPFASLKRGGKGRADMNPDNGWASEDVTDVQEAGDFDFQGSLARFDKDTIFSEMREQDKTQDADRLVSHNRLPRPKPGTAGGKNLHYTENVLDMPSAVSRLIETSGDYYKSEADDGHLNGSEVPSGQEGSGRNSRLRGESRVSTSRRSQSRKASATAPTGLPSRINSGPPPLSPTPGGLYMMPSKRRIETVTHLQMLVVENVAHGELGLTEDLMAENAGRGISEVAMRALGDPAITLRVAAASPPSTSTIVILVGNHKSGIRAVAAARHLRNRAINVLVCIVGIERERELLEDLRKQIRLFRNFGGVICNKTELFEHLTQSTSTLSSSSQAPVTLIIDALLGLTISFEELRKSDQATTYELMEWANRNDAFVMAIDIPSGIEPSSGKVNVIDGAKLYVQPRYIVALGAPKQGLLRALQMGEEEGDIMTVDDWRLYLVDIGLGAVVWRKAATKIRRGVDFEDKWVIDLRYQPRASED
ncbi:YjeF-related protein N-terminus-domain-containing protein [Xylariaceae sp. FL0804]|nr:YjeF-related protein N-terminus-domain-containing protein [Xylariaceae sp. FL0804]